MKVALVHDYIKEYGGAERVLETLHKIWPDATVFTSVYLPTYLGPHQERFRNWKIKTSILQFLPFNAKLISPFRLIAPLIFKQFDFSGYDVVIVSATGAYAPNMINVKSQRPVHICYCHTPPRYLYGYATAREWKKNVVFRVLGEVANHFLRLVDFKSAQNVDYFIANSEEVKRRIKKFYRRDATVINPPVEISNPKLQILNKSQNTKYKILNTKYYLAGGRLAKPKNIDLIVRTCTKLGLFLKVFGKAFAGYGEELKKHAGSTVEFLGEISDEEKLELMKGAKAYVFASEDEDFGITPVEAMSVGAPVIAYRSGGVMETVVDGKTGIFFNELSIGSLSKAIEQFNNITINSADCTNRAKEFSKERFKKEIETFVESVFSKTH